ncbi:MAG: DUF2442 domain-containing protein [Burkholderiales bacterium]|nr:DUF2442 domain-containing protein [Burkholderiales bacterium]
MATSSKAGGGGLWGGPPRPGSPCASPEQLAQVELSLGGLHWDALDEDISVAGLLAGQADLTRRPSHAAA